MRRKERAIDQGQLNGDPPRRNDAVSPCRQGKTKDRRVLVCKIRRWRRRDLLAPSGPVTLALPRTVSDDVLGMLVPILPPITRMLAAPVAVGLNIVVAVIGIGRTPGFLPAALALPLARGGRAKPLFRTLRAGMKEFAATGATPLLHTKPRFDRDPNRESSRSGGLRLQL